MRTFPLMIAFAASTVAASALAQGKIDVGDAPTLRAGYWEVTSTVQDKSGTETMKSFLCVDDAMQEKMSVFAQGGVGGMCSEMSVKPQGANRWAVRSVCNPGNMGRMVSEGTISGDMRTQYRSEMVTTGSMLGQPMDDKTVQDARHVGACPDGIVPGDIVMEEGKVNMLEMGATMEKDGGVLGGLGGLLGGGAQGGSAGQSQDGQAPAPSKGAAQDAGDLLQNLGGALGKMFGK